MTEIRNNAPDQGRNELLKISITEEGRKIEFKKPCLSEIHVYRKFQADEWKEIGRNVRFPFVDAGPLPDLSEVTYKVKVLADEYQGEYELPVFTGKVKEQK